MTITVILKSLTIQERSKPINHEPFIERWGKSRKDTVLPSRSMQSSWVVYQLYTPTIMLFITNNHMQNKHLVFMYLESLGGFADLGWVLPHVFSKLLNLS